MTSEMTAVRRITAEICSQVLCPDFCFAPENGFAGSPNCFIGDGTTKHPSISIYRYYSPQPGD